MERYWGEKKTTPKSASSSSEKHISVQDNKIYYYSGVNRDSCSELNKKISELEGKYIATAHTLDIDLSLIHISEPTRLV